MKEWQAGWLWVAATTIGLVVGMVFYTLTGGELLVGAIMIGVLLGWLQMLILMLQRIRVGWLWLFNSIIAWVTLEHGRACVWCDQSAGRFWAGRAGGLCTG